MSELDELCQTLRNGEYEGEHIMQAWIAIESMQKEIADLNVAAKRAFWWSAEFTATSHNNKILNAWEDFLTHPHAAPLDDAEP